MNRAELKIGISVYNTGELYEAVVLEKHFIHDMILKIKPDGRVSFDFQATDKLFRDLLEYKTGKVMVNALAFAEDIKELRRRMYNLKKEEQEGDANWRDHGYRR
jgi:hypothetical protein